MRKFYIFEKSTKEGSILYLTQNPLKAMLFKKKHKHFEYWQLKNNKEIINFLLDCYLGEIIILNFIII